MAEHHLLDSLAQIVTQRKTFQAIMADGIVEEHEVAEQAALVQELITRLETELSDRDFKLVTELIAEIAVLHIVSSMKEGDTPKSAGEIWIQQLATSEE